MKQILIALLITALSVGAVKAEHRKCFYINHSRESLEVEYSSRYSNGQRRVRLPAAFWRDMDERGGRVKIEVNLDRQIAKFYRNGDLIGQSPISSGQRGFETKPGEYVVLEKSEEHYSSLYGEFVDRHGNVVGYGEASQIPPPGTTYRPAKMPHFLRLSYEGLGLHAGFVPGYPASHGCIRLPNDMAKKFYEATPVGAEVLVVD
jgi:lipoprotein-anchoring transpeptidase ErfK/SrfK